MAFFKRTKNDVKEKKTFFGKPDGNGKKRKLGTHVTFNDDTQTTLLNPSGQGAKYAAELRDGRRYTNSGAVKTDDKGQELPLTKEQRAYRSGFLSAMKANAKAYKAKQAAKQAKKK